MGIHPRAELDIRPAGVTFDPLMRFLFNGPLNRTADAHASAAVHSWVRSSMVERDAVNVVVGGSIPSGLAKMKPVGDC